MSEPKEEGQKQFENLLEVLGPTSEGFGVYPTTDLIKQSSIYKRNQDILNTFAPKEFLDMVASAYKPTFAALMKDQNRPLSFGELIYMAMVVKAVSATKGDVDAANFAFKYAFGSAPQMVLTKDLNDRSMEKLSPELRRKLIQHLQEDLEKEENGSKTGT